MSHAELLDAVWKAVPEDAVPERFDERRAWLLERVAPGDEVLDLGCGAGEFAAALAAHGARVVALDAAPEAVRRARARGVDAHLVELDSALSARDIVPDSALSARDIVPDSALSARDIVPDSALSLGDFKFDIAWLGETLEHLADPVGTLHEVRRVLRPKGRLLATTPDHPPELLHALADDPERFAEHFSPRTDHLRFFNATSLRALLTDLGFQDVDIAADGGTLFAQARW